MKPAFTSELDGSSGVVSDLSNDNAIVPLAGALNVAVGATLMIVRVALSVVNAFSSSVTLSVSVHVPLSLQVTVVFADVALANLQPAGDAVHRKSTSPPSGSLPVPLMLTGLP